MTEQFEQSLHVKKPAQPSALHNAERDLYNGSNYEARRDAPLQSSDDLDGAHAIIHAPSFIALGLVSCADC
jgi:hypothetical protein